jgi:hypothetical protein
VQRCGSGGEWALAAVTSSVEGAEDQRRVEGGLMGAKTGIGGEKKLDIIFLIRRYSPLFFSCHSVPSKAFLRLGTRWTAPLGLYHGWGKLPGLHLRFKLTSFVGSVTKGFIFGCAATTQANGLAPGYIEFTTFSVLEDEISGDQDRTIVFEGDICHESSFLLAGGARRRR